MTTQMPKHSAVVVSARPWNQDMIKSLEARTNYNFTMICEPSGLTVERLASIGPRFVFFPYWSHRIDETVYKAFECVVFHMTDLPFGRGGSPLQNLIIRGIYETKISAIRCVEELDAGPVYLKKPLSLHGSAEEIYLRASAVIADMIVEILGSRLRPQAQEGEPTFFKRRRPEDGNLSVANSLDQAFDMIRMLDASGYPPAFVQIGRFKIEFARAGRRTGEVVADARITLVDEGNDRSEQ